MSGGISSFPGREWNGRVCSQASRAHKAMQEGSEESGKGSGTLRRLVVWFSLKNYLVAAAAGRGESETETSTDNFRWGSKSIHQLNGSYRKPR